MELTQAQLATKLKLDGLLPVSWTLT